MHFIQVNLYVEIQIPVRTFRTLPIIWIHFSPFSFIFYYYYYLHSLLRCHLANSMCIQVNMKYFNWWIADKEHLLTKNPHKFYYYACALSNKAKNGQQTNKSINNKKPKLKTNRRPTTMAKRIEWTKTRVNFCPCSLFPTEFHGIKIDLPLVLCIWIVKLCKFRLTKRTTTSIHIVSVFCFILPWNFIHLFQVWTLDCILVNVVYISLFHESQWPQVKTLASTFFSSLEHS